MDIGFHVFAFFEAFLGGFQGKKPLETKCSIADEPGRHFKESQRSRQPSGCPTPRNSPGASFFILRNIFLREPSWGALRRRGYGLWYTMIILPQTPCQSKKIQFQIPHGSSIIGK